MVLIKQADFVEFLCHVFVGLESLDVRYYTFCPKHGVTGDVWRHNILTFHAASAENQREKSLPVSSLLELKYTSPLSCRRYDETKSFLVQGNLNFALMYRNNIEFSVFVLCHWVDCEIYWEYRTVGHLVFWKLWPAVELKKDLSVTKHARFRLQSPA